MSTAELERLLRAGAPVAPEALRVHVRELRAPAPRARTFALPRRGLLLAPAALVALAVAAAVVRGVTSSSPATRADTAAQVTTPSAGVLKKAPAGAAASTGGAATRLAPSVGAGGTRLQRYDASLRVRVDGDGELARATTQATRIARSLGGYAASVEYRTPAGRADLELRIPTARVQTALARLAALGTILSQRVSVQDLQRQLERQSAQIEQLRETIRLTQAALRDPATTPTQRVQLQIRLAAAKRALAQRTHARGATVAEGTLARVSLQLSSPRAAAAAPHREGRVGRMLGSAASFLALEATIALYALIVVSPLLALGALVWAAGRARRRRDEKRLLSAS
jgi:hypothetical protein